MKLDLLPAADDDSLDFTPMIAVLFLLVFFFMLISSFFDEAAGFRLRLPEAESPQLLSRDDAETVSLTVNEEVWYHDSQGERQLSSLGELETNLKERADRTRPVILRCDRHCTYEQSVRVKNALMNAGVGTIFEEMGVRK